MDCFSPQVTRDVEGLYAGVLLPKQRVLGLYVLQFLYVVQSPSTSRENICIILHSEWDTNYVHLLTLVVCKLIEDQYVKESCMGYQCVLFRKVKDTDTNHKRVNDENDFGSTPVST